MSYNYHLESVEQGYALKVSGYPKLNYVVVNQNMDENQVVEVIESTIDIIISNHIEDVVKELRKKRQNEFNQYDKHQLTLMWQSLTNQQQSEYANWRNAWLDVTETLVEPKRLSWFD